MWEPKAREIGWLVGGESGVRRREEGRKGGRRGGRRRTRNEMRTGRVGEEDLSIKTASDEEQG